MMLERECLNVEYSCWMPERGVKAVGEGMTECGVNDVGEGILKVE